LKLKSLRNKVINMGEEKSEELEELEAKARDEAIKKARDEAIKQMLKAWEERPEEKRGSWGTIFGHDVISRDFVAFHVTVVLAKESTMDVTAHATGDNNYSRIVQLSPGENENFITTNPYKMKNVKITGLGSEDQYAFGSMY
jgi:hypothetical protein